MDFGHPSNSCPTMLCPTHTNYANQSFTTCRWKRKDLLALLTWMGCCKFWYSWAGANVNYNFWRTTSSFCKTSKPGSTPTSCPSAITTPVPCTPCTSTLPSPVFTIWRISALPTTWDGNWIPATTTQACSASSLSSSFNTRTRGFVPSTIPSATRPSCFSDFNWVSGLK